MRTRTLLSFFAALVFLGGGVFFARLAEANLASCVDVSGLFCSMFYDCGGYREYCQVSGGGGGSGTGTFNTYIVLQSQTPVTPSQPPSGGAGTGRRRQNMIKQLQSRCTAGSIATETQRSAMLAAALTEVSNSLELYPECRIYVSNLDGEDEDRIRRDGVDAQVSDPDHDALYVFRRLRDRNNFRYGGWSPTAVAEAPRLGVNSIITVSDIFFGKSTPLFDCTSSFNCTDAELRREFARPTSTCSAFNTNTLDRAETVIHELGHTVESERFQNHPTVAQSRIYDEGIRLLCRLF